MQKHMIDSLIGKQLGNYRIERLLGRGGMASVYYGIDINLQRPAAIKVTDERYRGDTGYAERFLREARAMASWRHRNIPQVYGAGAEGGFFYYAMEYIQGMDLEQLISIYRRRNELVPPADVIRIAEAVAAALDYSHEKGTVHRDVKPSNILVARNGRIFLTDFGLLMEAGKETRGEVFGSPHYMSPEQARSSAGALPQSDLYSLGVVLYELFAGRTPFDDPSPATLALKHITTDPPAPRLFNPDLSQTVEGVLLNALRKNPGERYQAGSDLVRVLKLALNSGPARPVSLVEDTPTVTNPFLQQDGSGPPKQTVSKIRIKQVVNAGEKAPLPTSLIPDRNPEEGSRPGNIGTAALPVRKYGCVGLLLAGLLMLISGVALASRYIRTNQSTSGGAYSAAPSRTPLVFLTYTPTPSPTPTTTLTPAPTDTPTATLTSTQPPPTPTATQTVTFTQQAAQAPNYELLLAKRKDDSIFVVNEGSVDVLLVYLQLGKEDGRIFGDEWEVRYLHPGECVAAWKEEGNPQAPKNLKCELVGERIERSGIDKFWTNDFEILYRGTVVGECEDDDTVCEIKFQPSP